MAKQLAGPSILNLFDIFNAISKYSGFYVVKPNDSFLRISLREIIFFSLFTFSSLITVQVEIWFVLVLKMNPTLRKVVIFVISQIVVLAPISCLLCFRLRDFTIWKIVLRVKNLEENLMFCNMHLNLRIIGLIGLFFWVSELFMIFSLDLGAFWRLIDNLLIAMVRFYYFEAWVMIPCMQFVLWISFLSQVLRRVQFEIIEINQLAYLTSLNFCIVKERVSRMNSKGCDFERVIQIRRFICVMKQVLKISRDLSAAYGTTVFIFIVQYISRIILQFYDLIDRDAQQAPFGLAVWNVLARLLVLLPVFICCEHFSHNVNRTVELIQEIVMLYQPSRLDCIFQNLTLRLQHQRTTIQLCGFLNITYRSFLTIMTTALAFLLFQLQF